MILLFLNIETKQTACKFPNYKAFLDHFNSCYFQNKQFHGTVSLCSLFKCFKCVFFPHRFIVSTSKSKGHKHEYYKHLISACKENLYWLILRNFKNLILQGYTQRQNCLQFPWSKTFIRFSDAWCRSPLLFVKRFN